MSDPDCIVVTGLEVRGFHGVFDFERRDGQPFIVDFEVQRSLSAAAESDDVAATMNYAEAIERVSAIVSGEPVNLIETLAQRLADALLEFPEVAQVTVTVHKPQAPVAESCRDIAVRITRSVRTRPGGIGSVEGPSDAPHA